MINNFVFTADNHQKIRYVFLKALSVVYLCAFLSLAVQITGLIGEQGILPLQNYLNLALKYLGKDAYLKLPTVFWFDASNTALTAICVLGAALAVIGFWGILQPVVFFLMWVLYLSLTHAGQIFLQYQWDILLLECGFLAIFWCPLSFKAKIQDDNHLPSKIVLWLLWWLLFKLMFSSGVSKLMSGDPSWQDLTALTYHYFTQPLPTPLSWNFHHMSQWFHSVSAGVMFFVEVACPWLIFLWRPLRYLAAFMFTALMIVIMLSGNYGFFNLLTIALCIPLLDDDIFGQQTEVYEDLTIEDTIPNVANPEPLDQEGTKTKDPKPILPLLKSVGLTGVGLVLITLSAANLSSRFAGFDFLTTLQKQASSFYISNSYGLFATMTKQRREVQIQGSQDQKNWRTYGFKYKPHNLKELPPFITPHMPRFDWQMWFASLGTWGQNPWLQGLSYGILHGIPEVTELLGHNPFPNSPPRYLRFTVFEYNFSSPEHYKETGELWRQNYIDTYSTTITKID